MRILRVLPLAIRMVALATLGIAAAAAATALLSQWLAPWIAAGVATLCVGALMGIVVWRTFVPLRALFRALAGTVAGYRDGDFSFGVTWDKYSDLIELVDAHNELGNALRDQRLFLMGQPFVMVWLGFAVLAFCYAIVLWFLMSIAAWEIAPVGALVQTLIAAFISLLLFPVALVLLQGVHRLLPVHSSNPLRTVR